MAPAPEDLLIGDDLLAVATPAELARYEALLLAEMATLPDAPKPIPGSPGELAATLTGGTELQAPLLNLIDEIHLECRRSPGARFCISKPPRYGGTRRLVNWGVPWHLMHDPRQRFLYVTYGADLAQDSSRFVRDLLRNNDLGIRPRRDVDSVSKWELEGHPESGMIAIGLDGPSIGKGGHLLCDDLIKTAKEAESRRHKQRVYEALTETLLPRLEPGSFAIILMARWAEDDPIGRLMEDDPNGWTFVNVPALCIDPETDPVGRSNVGDPLWPERWPLATVLRQQETNPRFEAQYQGRPERVRRSGGVFDRERIARNRRESADRSTFVRVGVGVDPSASDGPDSDEAGVIVGAKDRDGRYLVLEDASGRMEPERWARVALLAALRWGADFLAFEQNLVKRMMQKVIDRAWDRLVGDVRTLAAATAAVAAAPDDAEARERLDLLVHGRRDPGDPERWDVEPMPDAAVLLGLLAERRPMVKPRIIPVHAKAGKELRAEPVSQLYAQNLVSHVGTFPTFEKQLTKWRPGQGSPDRMDAGVHLLTELADLVEAEEAASPAGTPLPRPVLHPVTIGTAGFGRPAGR